ncbi:hypothetical protein GALMADRAFT_64225, partial [Galerina marginata CBS 339.88]
SDMPARAVFQGQRTEFLEKQRANYAEALKDGSKDDFLKEVVRRFFKRFPIELGMDGEPTEDQLKAVDDSKPDQELPIPNAKEMSPEEYRVALKTYEERKDFITRRTAQIARWFAYRHEKELGVTKEIDLDDPITVLTCRLTGASSFKPRKPVANNMVDINMRQEVVRALFKELPSADRGFWNLRAEQEHRRLLRQWEETIQRPASTDPEARQQCIDGITGFMQPILDLVFEFTGMPTTFMMGGPEPADKGRLNIISLHSGSVQGPVKMNFGEAEQAGYKEHVVPVFSRFLRKCFTREDCRAAALPSGAASLLAIIGDHSINYDRAVPDLDPRPVTAVPRPLTPGNDRPSCPPSAPPSPSSPRPASPAIGAEAPPINPSSNQATRALPPDARQAEDASGNDSGSKRRRPSDKENKGSSRKRKNMPDKEDDLPSKRIKPSGHGTPFPSSSASLPPIPSSSSSIPSSSTPSTSTSTPSTSTPATESVLPLPSSLPKDCQPAVKNTLDLVKRTPLGVRWDRLVDLWLRFEGSYEFEGSSRLSTTSRPSLIGEWVRRARVPTYSPSIDTGEFGAEFWAPGTNGWPNIVAALFFWGRAHYLANQSTSSWKLAVKDVIWVLENLCQLRSA